MEATRNCIIAIGTIQEAGKQAKSMIDPIYEGNISHLVDVQPLVMPYVRHMYVLLPLVMPYIRHAYLGLHIGVRLKATTAHI